MAVESAENIHTRVRALEMAVIKFAMLFDSDTGPGLLSSMKTELLGKLDAYAQTVNTFIAGEPGRKAHIERNAQQAISDAKTLIDIALKTAEDKQMKLHEDNRRDANLKTKEISHLRSKLARHERFVQRGIGIIIACQVLIMLVGFAITTMGAVLGLLIWLMTHAPFMAH